MPEKVERCPGCGRSIFDCCGFTSLVIQHMMCKGMKIEEAINETARLMKDEMVRMCK